MNNTGLALLVDLRRVARRCSHRARSLGPFPAAAVAADLVVVTIVAHVPKGFDAVLGLTFPTRSSVSGGP